MASTTRTETVTPVVLHFVPSAEAPEATKEEIASHESHKQVAWEEGTLDNEDLGRKSSKVCCIYHKPRAFAESSSESSSSDDDEGAKKAKKERKTRKCKHEAGEHQDGHKPCCGGPPDAPQLKDKPEANPEDQ